MRPSDPNYFNIGTRLTVTFALLIILILGGNGLVIWQFNSARTETDRLVGANQQMTAVLRLQMNLLSFHRRLDDLALSKEYPRLAAEAKQLRAALHEETEQTRLAVSSLPTQTRVEPALWPTLEAIEIILPSQLDAITELARKGDWDAVQLRLSNQLIPVETQTAILVDSVDRQASHDHAQALEQMRAGQRRILILVPATAICSFLAAALFGWSIARRIIQLRLEERVTERVRIARELHDTLLQTIQASRMIAEAALEVSGAPDHPGAPDHQREALEKISAWLEQAMREGRAALNSLRTSMSNMDLSEGLRRAIAESRRQATAVSFSVVGDPRNMDPVAQNEIYRIGYEAIRNACEHSHTSHLEVELTFGQDLALRVKDNGVGIEPDVIQRGKPGRFGLQGMRERAARIGGKFTLVSTVPSGTEVELIVPGVLIFREIASTQESRLAKVRNLFLRFGSPSKPA
jgi:signal transduction histidine kinase